ncbi:MULTISPECIES: sensor histidine kinase [Nocardioides]|uniref:sensor histidine kinase n=1 Tax=Nocardioides TaxID=1839 RepID=UPI000B1BC0CF|nr:MULTISPECIES: ATP-binding protein [Nocardioides]
MMFSGDPAVRRWDLLDIVSVLDVDSVLERATAIAAERTRAQGLVLTLVDEPAPGGTDAEEPSSRILSVRGMDAAEAAALRERLGASGLRGGPGARPEQDVSRLGDRATGREVLRVPVVVGERLYADLLLLAPPDGFFDDDDVESIAALGRVTGVAVRNALSYTLSERRRESLELAAAVDRSIRPPFLLSDPLTRLAEGALRMSGARTAVVVQVATDPDRVDVSAGAGVTDGVLARTLGAVTDRVLAAQQDGEGFVVRHRELTVWGVPLDPEHAFHGVVVMLLDGTHRGPSADDRELLGAFVRHCSLVLDHAVLQHDRQHAVLAADRDRIARDLHDGVIQRLYATALKLRAGIRSGEDTGGHGDEAVREIGDSIRDIRGTVFELERGRSASLRGDVLALAREYEPVLGFLPAVRSWGPVDSLVPAELADQATVVLREALSNCARHAGAGRVEVDVAVEDGWFTLWVTDDGRGMAGSDVPSSGLRNLRTRAAALGGDLEVQSAGRGTVLQWRVPLDR